MASIDKAKIAELEANLKAVNFNDATAPSTTVTLNAPPTAVTPFPPPPIAIDLTKQYAVILNIEQRLLDLIAQACQTTFNSPDYSQVLQRIKHFFFHRQFEQVFGDVKHLNVYVAQYLPMRALCYTALWSTQPLLQKLLEKDVTIYCIGAGPGSEAVGISMAREQSIRTRIRDGKLTLEQAVKASSPPKFRIHTQDLFDWTSSLTSVLTSLATYAPISYCTTHFTTSISNIMDAQLKTVQFRNSHVITMMFVINELFQENKLATMQFLERLTTAMRPGAFLIVADSAGDFSQLALGKSSNQQEKKPATDASAESTPPDEDSGTASDAATGAQLEEDETDSTDAPTSTATSTSVPASSSSSTSKPTSTKPVKRYWVYTLLDAIPTLKIIEASDSLWYRYPGTEKNLKYPLKFENMRYFLRIYQKKA